MTKDLENYNSKIKRKHSVAWTPKFIEEFHTHLNEKVFIPIAIKTFEKLGWDLVFQNKNSVVAKRKMTLWQWGQKITVNYAYGKVNVKSESLGSEYWDRGLNSKRVKLFIYAFKQTEKEFDRKALSNLEKEVERIENWDDYQIPDSLPQPKKWKKPRVWIPISGGILTALLLGFLVAWLSVKTIYLIGLFEVGVAFAIAYALKVFIKASNYTNYHGLHYLLIVMVALVFISSQLIQHQLILNKYN